MDWVIDDLHQGIEAYSPDYILFNDECLTCRSRNDLREFCDRYRAEIGIPFRGMATPPSVTEEKIDRSAALRKVLDIGLREYSKGRSVEEYRAGRMSVGRAAEEAGISIAEFYRVLSSEGVPINVDVDAIRSALRTGIEDAGR